MLFVHAPLLRANTPIALTLAKGALADAGGSGRGMWPDDGIRGLEAPPRGFMGCSPARRSDLPADLRSC